MVPILSSSAVLAAEVTVHLCACVQYAERARLASINSEGDVAVSAVASSPTNSSRSRVSAPMCVLGNAAET